MEIAEGRFAEELDIGTFIQRQRRQYIAFKVLFTKMERYLLRNNKFFVLHDNTDDSDEEVNWSEGLD